jgi:hypothetical protein
MQSITLNINPTTMNHILKIVIEFYSTPIFKDQIQFYN